MKDQFGINYFFLENTVQRWYIIMDELRKQLR